MAIDQPEEYLGAERVMSNPSFTSQEHPVNKSENPSKNEIEERKSKNELAEGSNNVRSKKSSEISGANKKSQHPSKKSSEIETAANKKSQPSKNTLRTEGSPEPNPDVKLSKDFKNPS